MRLSSKCPSDRPDRFKLLQQKKNMKRKLHVQKIADETTFSRLLGPPQGNRPEPPHCAAKMGIEDAYIHCQVKVFSKHHLIYEFKQGGIHEKLFSRRQYHRAGRDFEMYLDVLADIMTEKFLEALRSRFGWNPERGRPRQTKLIFLLPEEVPTSAPEGVSAAQPKAYQTQSGPTPTVVPSEDFSI